jgi:hypothetical protein
MLSACLKNNFSIVPLNEQWVEIIIKADLSAPDWFWPSRGVGEYSILYNSLVFI